MTTAVANSGARGAVVLLAVVGIFATVGGALGLSLAWYRRSHVNVFARLVRERVLVSGVVERVWRGPRGREGIKVVFETEDGVKGLVREATPRIGLQRPLSEETAASFEVWVCDLDVRVRTDVRYRASVKSHAAALRGLVATRLAVGYCKE